MKAVLAALSSVIVVAIPGLAHAGEDGLNASLASATARAMNVAPWDKVSVVKVVAEDQLSWLARSSGGQFYVCSAPPTADAVLTDQVSCTRATATAAHRAKASQLRSEFKLLVVSDVQSRAWADSKALAAQQKRMRVIIPGDMGAEAPLYSPMVTLSAR